MLWAYLEYGLFRGQQCTEPLLVSRCVKGLGCGNITDAMDGGGGMSEVGLSEVLVSELEPESPSLQGSDVPPGRCVLSSGGSCLSLVGTVLGCLLPGASDLLLSLCPLFLTFLRCLSVSHYVPVHLFLSLSSVKDVGVHDVGGERGTVREQVASTAFVWGANI